MLYINPYRFGIVDPLNNHFTPTGDELWSNPANWSLGHVPLPTETATIDGGNITLDVVTTINKMVIAAGRTLSVASTNRSITVTNEVTSLGVINYTGFNAQLTMNGTGNSIASFIAGTLSTVSYSRSGAQDVLPLTYFHLNTNGAGTKSLTGNTTVSGNFRPEGAGRTTSTFDFASYNLTVIGVTNPASIKLYRSGQGNLTFIGKVNALSSNIDQDYSILNSASIIEFRGGFDINNNAFLCGDAIYRLTTNNQDIRAGNANHIFKNVEIIGGITVTNVAASVITMTNVTALTGKLLNKGQLRYNNNVFPIVQGGGSLDILTAGNTIGLTYNGDMNVPTSMAYINLWVGGTGIKTLTANLTVTNFTFEGSSVALSTWDLGNYNMTINGTSSYFGGTMKRLVAGANTGAGDVIHVGNASTPGSQFHVNMPGMGSGNYMEYRNGFATSTTYILGSGYVRFTTNNQAIHVSAAQTIRAVIENITVTSTSLGTNSINGTTGGSTIINTGTLNYSGAGEPMATGVLSCNTTANTFIYSLSGNQDIKAGIYRTLTLSSVGVAGVKRLLGNVSVVNTYTLTAPATLDLNGFALTNP